MVSTCLWSKNGKVVFDTACVTGNESQGHATPAGTYGITYKQRNATLRGENYETPVSYWMPFNGGIGFMMRIGEVVLVALYTVPAVLMDA